MPANESTEPSLRAENAELRARLKEAEEALRAIRAGEVDALVGEGDAGPQLFTPQGLDAEQSRLRGEMLAQVSDAVIAADLEQRLTFLNAAAERQYGVRAGEVLGRTLPEIFTSHWPSPVAEAGMRTALSERGEWRGELIHRTRDGRELPVETSIAILLNPETGERTGLIVAIRDITKRKAAEAALRRNTALFSKIIEQAPGGVYVVDAQFRVAQMNAESLPFFASVQPLIGRDFDEVLEIVWGPEIGPQCASLFRHTLATGERYVSPRFSEQRHDIGVEQAFEWETQRITLPDGQYGVVCYFQDVTEREHAAAALRLAHQRFDLAVKCSQVVLFQQDLELRYTWLQNPVPGFEGSAAVGKRDADLMERAADAALTEALKREVIRSGVSQRQEVLVHIQGVGRHFDLLVEPQRDAAGRISGVTCAAIDITERKLAEEARHEMERHYRALAVASSEVAYRMSADWSTMLPLDGRALVASSDQPVTDWAWLDLNLPPDEHPRVGQAISEAIARKTLFELEHRVRRPDGSIGWTFSRAVPILDENEEVIAWFGAASDITARKQAEQALADRTELLNGVLEGTTDVIFVKGLDGRVLLANAACAAVHSSTPEQVVGKTGEELCPPDLAAAIRQHDEAVIAGGTPIQLEETFLVAGEARVYLTLKAPLRDGSSRVVGILGVSRDITERSRVEEALRESEARFRAAVGAVSSLIWTNNARGEMEGEQPGWGGFTGQSQEEYQGYGWARAVHPEDSQTTIDAWNQAVAEKRIFEGEHRVRRNDGEWRLCAVRAVPLLGEAGDIREWVGVHTDITERKQTEMALRDNAVMLADLDHRKDAFLATLSHELRNPLGVISSSLQLLRLTGQDREAVQQGCARMERQVVLLTRLIDDLMDVSRINEDKLTLRTERLDLATVAQIALETSRRVIDQRGHTVTVVLPPQPIEVDGDATRLAQVVSNLLTNAAKYSDPGSPIVLTVERQRDVAAVSVRDRGIGIAPADLRRVFELFAQVGGAAHLAQGGIGIGLHLVKRVVELHGGSVEALSEGLGHGSEFLVRLPLASSGARPERPADREVLSPAPSRRYRILVADDNEDAVNALALLLRHLGHDVRTAENGAQAVAVAATFRPEVALLDIGMPELDGHEACRRIRAQPGGDTMLLVALSGWGQDEDKRRARDAGFQHHLVKPVDPAALTELLHSLAPT